MVVAKQMSDSRVNPGRKGPDELMGEPTRKGGVKKKGGDWKKTTSKSEF